MEPQIQYAKTSDGVSIAYYTRAGSAATFSIDAMVRTH